ncbi:ThiF family adenylyltransferase [Mesorhizobium sp.]|uniref:ThiF family adenylyltransferase n=1 Tax=Mesorhizobium sp. TaxID=1871066 RepID=UPI000FE7DFEB|nr:ThiF family adenylyltransferase [Mesorhizobium sp.]RWM40530.1 MAG: ThiF family adenylyltransferase [Mesorhizobium sp.]RWM44082.1 MAG: ThiF family adenylyltransferase [Mesorhizobium sp.]RWM58108.1 MAG: ThiF family adenylyltransferase [Mesorhizobium sp.]TIO65305.1 MAG: ThiF family adenylyltransferase [Mesorhizobium sp.]TJV88821.1 MAG: ThiF family adenylyltransferase [Mesorhizobium sp.]
MTALRFAAPEYDRLARTVLAHDEETCAVVFTRSGGSEGAWIAADWVLAPEDAYSHRDGISAELRPAYLVEIANRARKEKLGVALVHTHPQAIGQPCFSTVDDAGEQPLSDYFGRRVPAASHLALVIGPDGCRARRLGIAHEIPVWEIGTCARALSYPGLPEISNLAHDRQVRAFGPRGQAIISHITVAIVGLGGTGSAVAQQLAHLGVRRFILIDPDVVEMTNLNRLVGATPADIGRPKVDVAERHIRSINPAAEITALRADIVDEATLPALYGADFLFLCTDSHASRAVVGQLAYQFLLPCIDMGVSITVRENAITHVTGRTQMLAPGLPCLVCTQALDGEQIRREMLTPEQRAADPYVQGIHEPQPAVISLNSTVASLAATMFLSALTPVPSAARLQFYDGLKGTVRPAIASRVSSCVVCSPIGALGKGPLWPLPVRPHGARDG